MTPDELRRMSMDYCIIYEKGIKPVKAKKVFFFKTNMIKEFNKFKLDHNKFDAGVRGTWRKFNPYNPDEFNEEKNKDLNYESLDDLFDDDKDNEEEQENTINNTKNAQLRNENTTQQPHNEIDELFGDDFEEEESETSQEDMLDIQKELEAKFDELFGSSEDDN